MSDLLNIFSGLLILAAAFAYFNQKMFRLPTAIGLMIMGLLLSIILLVLGFIFPQVVDYSEQLLSKIDFSRLVLNVLLVFFLFAGALQIQLKQIKEQKWRILSFATIGVLISTALVGTLFWLGLRLFDLHVNYLYCLLFGSIISPTDPIAVLGIMKKSRLPKVLEVRITGESLFNDGISVVVFISLYRIASKENSTDAADLLILLLQEVGGGLLLGMVLGYLGVKLLKTIDHYQTEVMITLAMVLGGHLIATTLHLSGPLSMVVAGLFVGNMGKSTAMSDTTIDYLNKFWEMLDEILNAALFVLIGLELMLIDFEWTYAGIAALSVLIVIGSRYVAIAIPSLVISIRKTFSHNALLFLTWGGLKGGLSIAMALSLQDEMGKNLLVTTTYGVVLFSILVQGLTLQPVIKKLMKGLDSPEFAMPEENSD